MSTINTYTSTMFNEIKDALKERPKAASAFKNVLKFTVGNTYTLRLVPFLKDPKKTIFHHYIQGWESRSTGQYVSYLSPTTYEEKDPISEERFRILKTGSDELKEAVKNVRRNENWMVNVYVVDDPTNPENNGTVKILKYGKQLHKIIDSAIQGEDEAEFGSRVFDLGPNGVNFKVKCETQGDFASYTSSRFTSPIDLKLDAEKINTILESAFDLEAMFTRKTYAELKEEFDKHFYCKGTEVVKEEKSASKADTSSSSPEQTEKIEPDVVADELSDEEINSLLDSTNA